MSAFFKSDGNDPSSKDKLMILVSIGKRISIMTLRKEVGMGSNLHDVVFDFIQFSLVHQEW
jgi:hypothetical protein